MRLFIDEYLSPQLARELNASGEHVAEHPLDFGGRGDPDHRVLQRCLARGLVIVTENARDFRALVGSEDIHPGLIVLPCVGREQSFALLQAAIDYLEGMGAPWMPWSITSLKSIPREPFAIIRCLRERLWTIENDTQRNLLVRALSDIAKGVLLEFFLHRGAQRRSKGLCLKLYDFGCQRGRKSR